MTVREYGYEYDAALDEALWRETESKVSYELIDGALALRSGRDAFKAVAREYKPAIALIPALACDSMVQPFMMFGHKVQFYKLHPDYSIDMKHLYSLTKEKEETYLFLYMDYFGNQSITDEDLERLREHNIVFISDRTQNYINLPASNFLPDYTVVSLRKWLNVPDGGLLWGKINDTKFSTDTGFSSARLKAQCMRREYLDCGDEKIKKAYRRIFSTVSDMIDRDPLPGRISAYSSRQLTDEVWENCRKRRRENSDILTKIFDSAGVKLLQRTPGASDLYVPILVENRDELQKRLSAIGIFTTLIWPISQEQRDICKTAKYTEEHMLGVPCDQRYTAEDAVFIGKTIADTIKALK